MFTNSGMMIDWTGIIIPARIPTKRSGASGKRSFANAKPAVVLTNRMSATAETVTIVELSSCWTTGSSSNRAPPAVEREALAGEELVVRPERRQQHVGEREQHHDGDDAEDREDRRGASGDGPGHGVS